MSDQANKYQSGLNAIVGQQQQNNYGPRLSNVWVAYWASGAEGEPLAVFPSKALAAVYLAGAEAAASGEIAIIEMPINYGQGNPA